MKIIKVIPMRISIGCFFFLTTLAACTQNHSDSLGPAMNSIFKQYNNATGPGCAVSVIRDGRVIFSKGYGIANLEYDIPITPSTIFDIASVSKQFTGLAISTLVEQGKVTLDDDIHKYLPEVPVFYRPVTVRQLLHHSGGVRDWPQTLNAAGWRWDEVFSFSDIMRMVRKQKDLDFEPGSRFSYSNTGYNLLAAIVEKLSGQTFRTWTDSAIFKPLGMHSSHFLDDYSRIIKGLAYSYNRTNQGFEKNVGELTAYGSSSLFTSVGDLDKWVINFQSQVSKKNPVYLRMLTEGTLNNGETVHYGYGLGHGEDRGLKTISHTGGWQGYRTIISNYPDENLSIIILSNAAEFDPQDYASRVAGYFLKDKIRAGEKPAVNVRDLPNKKVDSLLMKKYEGTYQLGPSWVVTLTLEKGRLMTQANGEDKFPMDAKSDSVFWIEAYGASMTFVQDRGGQVDLLKYKGIEAKRIVPFIPDPRLFNQYSGTYYSEELESQYKVYIKDSKLYMHHMRLGDFDLTGEPTGKDQFSGKIGFVAFYRDDHDRVLGFMLSGGRVKNLRFEKK